MASTHKSLRSGTANKRPTTSIADGQIALNTNTTSPGLFFKDSTGATIIKVGPVHVGTTAPNASPAAGGSAGNSVGEIWLDTSLTPVGVKIWNGSAFVNATPIGSTTVQGLLELATNAETQTGTDPDRAVTPAGLQSKVSDSTSTTSSTTIASSTAVKSAYDLANAALPKSGGTVTGNLEIGTTGSLSFEGATADAFETTIAVVDPTADRTITLPDTTGTVVTTGDTGTVTSTMIADGTIVNGDINASAAIAGTKISPDFGSQTVQTTGIFSHALGTAGAPTVTFTGDTNTGIYSPGADQVGISTGGQGRLFVDTSGRVGVGTSSLNRKFHVEPTGSTAYDAIQVGTGFYLGNTSDNASAAVFHQGGGATLEIGSQNYIYFTTGNAAGSAAERLRITSTGALNFVGAGTAGSTQAVSFNGSAPINSLVIDSSGRLGVGTSSPSAPLHVVADNVANRGQLSLQTSSASNAAQLTFYNQGSLRFQAYQDYSGNGDVNFVLNGASANMGFWTNNLQRLTIDSAGRVGIGTSSPNSLLHVDGGQTYMNRSGAGTQQVLQLNNSDTTAGTQVVKLAFGSSGSTKASINAAVYGNDYLTFNTGSDTERMRLDSSGRLGIGTTSPANALHVSGASGTTIRLDGANNYSSTASLLLNQDRAEIRTTIDASGGNPGGTLLFRTRNTSGSLVDALSINNLQTVSISSASGVAPLIVSNGGGEAFRVDDSRRLLVGTSTAATNYRIGTSSFTPIVQVEGTSPNVSPLAIQRTDGAPYLYIATGVNVSSGSQIGYISFNAKDGTNLVQAAQIGAECDGTPGTNDMPGRLVFSTTADGASSPTERMRITQKGFTKITKTGAIHSADATYHEIGNKNDVSGDVNLVLLLGGSNTANTASRFFICGDNVDDRLVIYGNGNVVNKNNSYGALSDVKLKENIVDASSQWSDIKDLRVRKYNLKDDTGQQTHTQIGLIAQEVELVSPGLVSESPDCDKDGNDLGTVTKSVNYSVLYMKAVKALQEAMERIEQLEAEMAEVKAQLS